MLTPNLFLGAQSAVLPNKRIFAFTITADGSNACVVSLGIGSTDFALANLTASGAGSSYVGPYLGKDGFVVPSVGMSITTSAGTPFVVIWTD